MCFNLIKSQNTHTHTHSTRPCIFSPRDFLCFLFLEECVDSLALINFGRKLHRTDPNHQWASMEESAKN